MSPSERRTSRRPEARGERLQKVLAAAGVASRRASEELILAGRVRVNGVVVRELGARADPARDRVTLDGRRVGRQRRPHYYIVHKPRGVVTTTRDPHAKKTVLDLVPARERLFPVGRLDAASEGLVLITNDGTLAQAMLISTGRKNCQTDSWGMGAIIIPMTLTMITNPVPPGTRV